jgi:crcB protein
MKEFIYIFLGGGLGSIARYSIHLLINGRDIVCGFPWATFTVNILGSFLIGIFYTLSVRFNLSNEVRLLLTVGFCGGFTTFSTFAKENLQLLKSGLYTYFILYTALSIILGILAALAGAYISK